MSFRTSRKRPKGGRLFHHLTASGALLLMAWTAPAQASPGKPLTDPPDAWRATESLDWRGSSEDDWQTNKAAEAQSDDAPPAFFQPAVEAGQVSQFSGAAGYSVAIPVPDGVGGLKVPLNLRYNSDLVSSKVGDFNSDGGWLGLGWDLEVGRIELTNRTEGDTRLMLNGQSSTLVYSHNELTQGPGQCTDGDNFLPADERWDCTGKRVDRLNVEEARFWRIRKTSRTWEKDVCECVEGCKVASSVPGRIMDDSKYEIWDKGGVKYTFGGQAYDDLPWQHWAGPGPNASSRAYHLQYREGEGPDYKEAVFRSWGLENIEDPHGNILRVNWKGYNTLNGWSHNCNEAGLGLPHWGFKEIYPSTIRYTTNAAQGDHHVEWEVEFVTSRKQFDTLENFGIAQSGVKLDAVKVWFYPPDGSAAILTSEHKFVYAVDHVDDTKSYRLTRIDRYGKHGSGGYDNQLPSLHFDYDLRTVQWNQTTYQRYFLTHVDDSIGGGLTFNMQDWDAPEYTKQVVQSKTVDPGIGPLNTSSYTYLEAVTETEDDGTERLVGFGRVRESLPDRRVDTTYLVYGSDPEHILTGKRHLRQVEDLAGTPLTLSEWKWWPDPREGANGTAGYFVKKYEDLDWMWDELGQEHSKKTHYLFDPALQGGEQAGNVTTVYYYDDAAAGPGDMYRSTVHHYGRNDTAWILDRKIQTTDHEGDPDPDWLRRTRWIWNDGATPDHTVVGDRGLLYAHRRSVIHSVGERMVDRAYDYDGFGNSIQEKVFYGFGLNDQYPSNACTIDRTFDSGTHSFLITETNCLGHQTDYFYYGIRAGAGGDGLPGQPQMQRDLNGLYTHAVQYDLKGRARYRWQYGTTLWDTSKASEVISYSSPDRWMKRRIRDDASGAVHYRTERTFYDALGRVIQTQHNWGGGTRNMVHTHYLPGGPVERTTTPRVKAWSGDGMDVAEWNRTDLHQTSYTYDALGRLKTKATTGRGTTRYAYDGPWGQVAEVNANDTLQRTQVYDTRGNSIRTEEWNLQTGASSQTVTTRRQFDVLGQLTHIFDDDNNMWRFSYDALGQKVWQIDPGRGAQIFTYNARGQMRHHRNAALDRTCYWFDDIGRTTARHTVGNAGCSSVAPAHADATFTYDEGSLGLGRRTGMQTADVTVAWTYDGKGRKTHEVVDYPGRQGPYTTRWTYHQDDRISTLRYPNGSLALYGYHGASGLPRTLYVDNQPVVGEATYDALGRIGHMELGNGYDIDRTFGSTNLRLHSLTSSHSGTGDTFTMQYHWDVLGNLKYFYDFRGADDVFEDAYFGYDFLGRLRRAWTDHSGAPYDLTYGYDALGNLETIQNHLTGVTDTWTYQAGIPHAKTHRNGVQKLTYDSLGRVIDRQSDASGSFQYTWDTADRMLSVQGPSGHHTLVRDADGRLAASLWAAQDTFYVNPLYEETYVHIGSENIVGGQETAPAKATSSSSTSSRATYLFGDQPIAQRKTTGTSSHTFYLHPDHLGSIHMVTDGNGNIERRTRNLPFGQQRWTYGNSSASDRDLHSEKKFDRYGDIYSMGSRFYDPEYRTWLTADTVLPNVERPQSLNAYAFVEGNPLRYTDPSGHAVDADGDESPNYWRLFFWFLERALALGDAYERLPIRHASGMVGVGTAVYDVVEAHGEYEDALADAQAMPTEAQQILYSDVAFGEFLYNSGIAAAEGTATGMAWAGGATHVGAYGLLIETADQAGTLLAEEFGVGMVPSESAGLLAGNLGTIVSPYDTSNPNCDSLCVTASLEYDQTGNAGDAIIFLAQAADNARDLRDLGGQIIENGTDSLVDWWNGFGF